MTARSMFDRLRQRTGARNDCQLADKTGVDRFEISKIKAGLRTDGMRVKTLHTISVHTGVGIGTLAEWWAEDEKV